jgi:ADP-ribose pyrophosphatase YjhB (NUDIX family)
MHSFKLNDAEIAQAEQLLGRLEPGFMPFPLFLQIYRLTPSPSLEFIPFRRDKQGSLEVLLLQRPADDPIWPGEWHNPGRVLRAGETFESATASLLHEELQAATISLGPTLVTNLIHQSRRGTEASLIYWIELVEPVPCGTFWPLNALPENVITSEIAVIRTAADHYEQAQQSNA